MSVPEEDIIIDCAYWEKMAASGPELEPRKGCCGDCPSTDMYLPYVEGLKRQDPKLREAASKRWFCHCTPDKMCYGNMVAQGLVESKHG